ncbi:MAG: response regulator transcription factor [Bacteroidetes bacterium]|nr:response regulator transcription factor [Bacteroidota bacterium]
MTQIRIAIADDHATVRGGLKYALETDKNIVVVGEASDGAELIELNRSLRPDILIVDVNMPKMNGINSIREIRKEDPDVKILMITMHQNESYIRDAFKIGINGYLFKLADIEEFLKAVHKISEGEEYFGEKVSKTLLKKYLSGDGLDNSKEDKRVFLTEREKEILKLIAEGFTSNEIGDKLFLSHYTIENHRKNMIQKFGIKNTTALVRYAIAEGIITSD